MSGFISPLDTADWVKLYHEGAKTTKDTKRDSGVKSTKEKTVNKDKNVSFVPSW